MTAVESTKKLNKEEKKIASGLDIQSLSKKQSVLVEPWITEKSHALMSENKYVFKIARRASKKEVEVAVERFYKVSVISVRIVNLPRKRRVIGRSTGWKSALKKAIVTLKEGDKIELFQGV